MVKVLFQFKFQNNATRSTSTSLLSFVITQHVRDAEIILKLKSFFDCGTIITNKDTQQFRIRNLLDLNYRLFPVLEAC